jgi:hypothetical protein
MAAGDVTVFNESMGYLIEGGWEPTDTIKVALVTSAATPAKTTASPALGDFTQVTAGGNYSAGGASLGTIGDAVSVSSTTLTFDSSTNPSWAVDAGNPTDARWGIIYNDTDASDSAIAFVDLGADIDMTAVTLTLTWNASGIFTISNA